MILMATGHRVPYEGFAENDEQIVNLKAHLNKELVRLKPQIAYAITGGAQGWDTWFGEACINQKIPYICYEPYREHGSKWDEESQKRHLQLIKHAKETKWLCEEYHKRCFLDRDDAMIQDSTHVIALFNPECNRGGTFYTVKHALKNKLLVYNLWSFMR